MNLEYAVFERPFARPFRYGGRSLTSRSGVLLRRNGIVSEASPLPGHSTDTVASVLEALQTRNAEPQTLPPSLRFALEGLTAQESPGKHPVRSNGLLSAASLDEARAGLRELKKAGYRTVKVKINPGILSWLPALLEDAADTTFRLDANQSLDPSSLEAMVKELEGRRLLSRVEYLEEPFAGVWDNGHFTCLPIALAADESADLRLLEAPHPPSVFILKPTVLGGLFSLENELAALEKAGKKAVFTSSMESEAGRRSLVAFLSRTPRETCGLSTGSLFAENFLPDQAEWREVPALGEAERQYLSSLSWKEQR